MYSHHLHKSLSTTKNEIKFTPFFKEEYSLWFSEIMAQPNILSQTSQEQTFFINLQLELWVSFIFVALGVV